MARNVNDDLRAWLAALHVDAGSAQAAQLLDADGPRERLALLIRWGKVGSWPWPPPPERNWRMCRPLDGGRLR